VPGADAEVSLRLTFAEAAFGARKELSVRLPVSCETCEGTGARPGTSAISCPDCQGTGEIRRIRQSLLGQVVTAAACGRCQGLGETIPTPCTQCRGEGRRLEDRSLVVEVPAGVEHGSTLRLADRGAAGPRGGPNGSLFVHLSVEADDRFERAGDDLHTTLSIAMTQAVLGCHVDVETLEEPRTVAIAPGTQSGYEIRLKGLGIPHLRGRGRGDLFIHVAVEVPIELSARQEELLRELAAERGEEVAEGGHDGVFSRLRSALADSPGAVAVRAAAAAQVSWAISASPSHRPDAHHLARVLRLRAGEVVVAADGAGSWRLCRYADGGRLDADGDICTEARAEPAITVGFAPVKGDRPSGWSKSSPRWARTASWCSPPSVPSCAGRASGSPGTFPPRAHRKGGERPVPPGVAARAFRPAPARRGPRARTLLARPSGW